MYVRRLKDGATTSISGGATNSGVRRARCRWRRKLGIRRDGRPVGAGVGGAAAVAAGGTGTAKPWKHRAAPDRTAGSKMEFIHRSRFQLFSR